MMKKLLILLMGILALLVLGYLCTQHATKKSSTGQEVSINSLTMKNQPGLKNVSLIADGDKATLRGTVDNEQQRDLADNIAKERGYFSIDNQITLADDPIKEDSKENNVEPNSVDTRAVDEAANKEESATNNEAKKPTEAVYPASINTDLPNEVFKATAPEELGENDTGDVFRTKPDVSNQRVTMNLSQSGDIKLAGHVNSQEAAMKLMEIAYDQYGIPHVETQLKQDANVDPSLSDLSETVLGYLPMLREAEATVTPEKLTIEGKGQTQHEIDMFKTNMLSQLPEQYQSHFDIQPMPIDKQAEAAKAAEVARAFQEQCQQNLTNTIKDNKILFKSNSSELLPKSYKSLDHIFTIFAQCKEQNIVIEGHTDSLGDKQNNIILSKKRAESVLQYLKNKGVDDKHLTTTGHGSSKPIASNNTGEGRSRNRRIEFIVQGI